MKRASFMTQGQREALGKLPRTHKNCLDKCKVARPGKTGQDRARKERKE